MDVKQIKSDIQNLDKHFGGKFFIIGFLVAIIFVIISNKSFFPCYNQQTRGYGSSAQYVDSMIPIVSQLPQKFLVNNQPNCVYSPYNQRAVAIEYENSADWGKYKPHPSNWNELLYETKYMRQLPASFIELQCNKQ
jgi:hypothetical protein